MKKYLVYLFLILFSLTACSNLNDLFNSDFQNKTDSVLVCGLPCSIFVNVSDINENDNAKMISPGNLTWDEIAKIILLANDSEFKTWTSTEEKTAYEVMQSDSIIKYTSGTYTFEIQLFNSNGTVLASGKIPNKAVYSDKENHLNFTTERTSTSGKGNVHIEFNCKPEDNIYMIWAKIFSYDDPSKQLYGNFLNDYNKTNKFVYNLDAIEPGKYYFQYVLHSKLPDGDSTYPFKTVTDVIVVEADRTTNAVLNVTSSDVITPISFNLGTGGRFKDGYTPVFCKNPGEEPALPTKDDIECDEGYEFFGWFNRENLYGQKFTSMPKELYNPTTFYACYTKIINASSLRSELNSLKSAGKTGSLKIKGDGVTSFSSISSVLKDSSFISGNGLRVHLDLSECTGVTEVAKEAFYSCNELASVILPESITTIKERAFNYTWNITYLYIPESVTTLEYGALSCMRPITEIKLPSGIKEIPDYLCQGCYELKKINIPDGVTSIGSNAFSNTDLEEIDIPSSVKTIGEWAFAVTDLKEVTIPEGVTSIGDNAFWLCSCLSKVSLPESLETIGNGAFTGSRNVETNLPKNLINIGARAFENCSKITSVNFSDKLKTIGEKAFAGCSIKEVYIPETVESIGGGAFACSSLEKITVSSSNPKYGNRNNCNAIIGIETDEETKVQTVVLLQTCKNSVIPEGIEKIDSAYYQSDINEITIPNTVKEITDSSFAYCTNLENIEIPGSVKTVGYCVFEGCSKLKKIVFSEGVEKINGSCFEMCKSLEEIVFPSTLNELGDQRFDSVYGLKKITLPNININGIDFYNFSDLETITFLGTEAEWTERSQGMYIPDGVEVIWTKN